MKKLLSLLAVAAIVTSAFAFKTNSLALTYCVLDTDINDCVLLRDHVEESGPANRKHFPYPNEWDGTKLGCQNAGPADCDEDIRLSAN